MQEPTVLRLCLLSFRGEPDDLAPARRRVRHCHGTTVSLQPPHAHGICFPGHAGQSGQIAGACPRAVEDTQSVGTDGQRDPCVRFEVDGEGVEDPAEERREGPARWEWGVRTSSDVPPHGFVHPAALGGMDHREVCRRLDAKRVEDGPECPVQPGEAGSTETPPPTIVNDGWERRPDALCPQTGSAGAHRRVVLGRLAQGLALRWCDRDVPPPPEAVEEEFRRARPCAQRCHRDAVGIDVLQHVGPQRRRDEPRSAAPGVGSLLAGGAMGQAVLGLVVELHRVRDEGLRQQRGERGRRRHLSHLRVRPRVV